MGYGLYGFSNPAILTYAERFDLMFNWADEYGEWNDLNHWGLFTAVPNIGFGVIHQENSLGKINDYQISFGFGDRSGSLGIGYGWSDGNTKIFRRSDIITIGSLIRPNPYLSFGLIGNFACSSIEKEGIIDLAIRPFGNELISLFSDYAIQDKQSFKNGSWSVGTVVEFLSGVRFTARYFDCKTLSAGFQFSFGHFGVTGQSYYDESQKHSYNTYSVRLGAYDRNIFRTYFQRRKKYLKLDFYGPLRYQRYAWFDKSNTLSGLISTIDAAKEDNTIEGVVINTSGMRINSEMLWELREKLKNFKSAGKHVIIYIDNVNIAYYHFATVADKIILDPMGSINLQGMIYGSFYLKGTLKKIGIGFDEWRLYKYKSAVEIFSRDSMSEPDREQNKKYIDDCYALIKSDICEARNISPEKFDNLVNKEAFFMPDNALQKGLVDQIGRLADIQNQGTITNIEKKERELVNPDSIARYKLPKDNEWGEKPQIAVIYALGVCAMDIGITARKLVKDIEKVMDNDKIKAVVIRVDSPGGSALASDIIAEAIKKCKEEKPVIVSQGFLAASGGYWLSMYADSIVAAPNTISGSIGVIGGWIYNAGLKEKLGVSTDFVKKGEHADLGFGMPIPFVGFLPDRNLDEDEKVIMEDSLKTIYKEFVEKVAKGRKKKYDEIESIAQGRIWSGSDAKQNGLVDELGGLEKAIQIAKEKADIPKEQKVKIIELPKKGLIDPNMYMPKLFGIKYKEDKIFEHLKFRLDNNGKPLPVLPIQNMQFE